MKVSFLAVKVNVCWCIPFPSPTASLSSSSPSLGGMGSKSLILTTLFSSIVMESESAEDGANAEDSRARKGSQTGKYSRRTTADDRRHERGQIQKAFDGFTFLEIPMTDAQRQKPLRVFAFVDTTSNSSLSVLLPPESDTIGFVLRCAQYLGRANTVFEMITVGVTSVCRGVIRTVSTKIFQLFKWI